MIRLIILGIVLAIMLSNCAQQAYVLPTADGGPEPSPPSVQGRISRVSLDEIEVTSSQPGGVGGSKAIIRIEKETEVFTVYGGYVPVAGLVEGQAVRIWLVDPTSPQHRRDLVAAVIMLASKDPRDDWPK